MDLQVLKDQVHSYISEPIHSIHLAGDIFDRKLSLGEVGSRQAIQFVSWLYEYKHPDTHLCLIQGTRSHDHDQLEIFRYLTSDSTVHIYKTATIEELSGIRVCFIPEEYMDDPDRYYSDIREELSKEPAPFMVGHGTWEFAAHSAQISESERGLSGSPILKYEDWKDLIVGPILFGHIHNSMSYKKKIYYPGSWSRWAHGEEDPKGALFVTIDPSDGSHTVERVPNPSAREYVTVPYSDVLNDDIPEEDILETLSKYVEDNDHQVIRWKPDVEIPRSTELLLKENSEVISSIKIIETKSDRWDYLSRDAPVEVNVQKYLSNEFEKEIDLDIIKEVIYDGA